MTTPPQPFNRISHRYRFVNIIISFGLDVIWRRSAIKAAGLSDGMTILDVGSGPGEMLALAPRDTIKIGADPEVAMFNAGKERFNRIRCVGEKLPIGSGRIDRVLSAFVLRNLTDRLQTFRECFRVLKSGGRGAFIDFSTLCNGSMWNPVNVHLKFVLPVIGGLLSGDIAAYRYLSRTIMAFPQPSTIYKELAEAGFTNISYKRLFGGVAVLYTFMRIDAK